MTPRNGVRVVDARRLLLGLPNIAQGRSYGPPSFLLDGRFFARFPDDDTVWFIAECPKRWDAARETKPSGESSDRS